MKWRSKIICALMALSLCVPTLPQGMAEEEIPAIDTPPPQAHTEAPAQETPRAETSPEAEPETPVPETPRAETSPEVEPETPVPETPVPTATESPTEAPTAEPTEAPTPAPTEASRLSMDEKLRDEGLSIPAEGVSGKRIQVSANVEWRAKTDAEWIHFSNSEKDCLLLTVDANAGEAREGLIELKADGCATLTLRLRQSAGAEATLEPEHTEAPTASESPLPEETLVPEETPGNVETPVPSETPMTTETPSPSDTPAPTEEDQLPDDQPSEEPPVLEPVERDYSIGWKGVVRSDEAGMAIPMLFQGDYKQVILYYDGTPRSVSTSGCGATSVSMIVAYLTGNTEQNPYLLFCEAVDENRYHGSGLSHGTLQWLADKHGVSSKWISNSAEAVLQALNEGKPVIAHMGEGIFTTCGHYIVLRGVTEDGKILLNDPNSRSNCGKAFPIETILAQTRTSDAFMVCWVEDMPAAEPAEVSSATLEPMSEADSNSAEATAEPTVEPTETPTAEPPIEPTAEPTEAPTAEPPIEPTTEPTEAPTAEPTIEPTAEPTEAPTAEPTIEPTAEPTEAPTVEPTVEPTAEPTAEPTLEPTVEPAVQTPALVGDFNGSGLVDVNDVQYLYEKLLEMQREGHEPTADELALYDLNGDGKFDINDANYLLDRLDELETQIVSASADSAKAQEGDEAQEQRQNTNADEIDSECETKEETSEPEAADNAEAPNAEADRGELSMQGMSTGSPAPSDEGAVCALAQTEGENPCVAAPAQFFCL